MREPPAPPSVPPGSTFSFGQSPFLVKGVLYRGTQSFFERSVPGGYARLLQVLDPPHRAFMDQTFLASRLYDVMPVPALIEYEAFALGQSVPDYLLARTRWQADQDLGGVYQLLLRAATPGLVIGRLPKVLIQMFDFPSVAVERPSSGSAIATFHRIPAPLEQWLSIGFSVYIRAALQAAGATSIAMDLSKSSTEGHEAGLAACGATRHDASLVSFAPGGVAKTCGTPGTRFGSYPGAKNPSRSAASGCTTGC